MPGRPRKNFVSNRKRRPAVSAQQFFLEHTAEEIRVLNVIHAACGDIEAALPQKFFLLRNNTGKRMRGIVRKFHLRLMGAVSKEIAAGMRWRVHVWERNQRRKT